MGLKQIPKKKSAIRSGEAGKAATIYKGWRERSGAAKLLTSRQGEQKNTKGPCLKDHSP